MIVVKWDCEGTTARTDLRIREVGFDHVSDVRRVALVQGSVHFIQDVDGSRVVAQQSQDEGQSDQGSLTTAQLRQGLLPDVTESDLDF